MNKYFSFLAMVAISSSLAVGEGETYKTPTVTTSYDSSGNQIQTITDPITGVTFEQNLHNPLDNMGGGGSTYYYGNSTYSFNDVPTKPENLLEREFKRQDFQDSAALKEKQMPNFSSTDSNGNVVKTTFNPENNTLTYQTSNSKNGEIISTQTFNSVSKITTIESKDVDGYTVKKSINPNTGDTNTITVTPTGQINETRNDKTGVVTTRKQQNDGTTVISTYNKNDDNIVKKIIAPNGEEKIIINNLKTTLDAKGNATIGSGNSLLSYNPTNNSLTKANGSTNTTINYSNGITETTTSGNNGIVYTNSNDPIKGISTEQRQDGFTTTRMKDSATGYTLEKTSDGLKTTTIIKNAEGLQIPTTSDANGNIIAILPISESKTGTASENEKKIMFNLDSETISTVENKGSIKILNTHDLSTGKVSVETQNTQTNLKTSTEINGQTGKYTSIISGQGDKNFTYDLTNSFDPLTGLTRTSQLRTPSVPVKQSDGTYAKYENVVTKKDAQTGLTIEQIQNNDGTIKSTIMKNAKGEIIPTNTDARGIISAKITGSDGVKNPLTYDPQTNSFISTTSPNKGDSITTIKNIDSGIVLTNTFDSKAGTLTTKTTDGTGAISTKTTYASGIITTLKTKPDGSQTTQTTDIDSGLSFSQKIDSSGKPETILITNDGREIPMKQEKNGTFGAKLPNSKATITFDPKTNKIITQSVTPDGNTSTTTKGTLAEGSTTVITNKNNEIIAKSLTKESYDPLTSQLATSNTKIYDPKTEKVSTSTTKSYVYNPDNDKNKVNKITTSTFDPVTNQAKITTTDIDPRLQDKYSGQKMTTSATIVPQGQQPKSLNINETVTNPDGTKTRTYIDKNGMKRVDTLLSNGEKISSQVFPEGATSKSAEPDKNGNGSSKPEDNAKGSATPPPPSSLLVETRKEEVGVSGSVETPPRENNDRLHDALTADSTQNTVFTSQQLELAKPADNAAEEPPAASPPPPPPPASSSAVGNNPPLTEAQKVEAGSTAELAEKLKRTEKIAAENASVKPVQNGSPPAPQLVDIPLSSTPAVPGGSTISTQDKESGKNTVKDELVTAMPTPSPALDTKIGATGASGIPVPVGSVSGGVETPRRENNNRLPDALTANSAPEIVFAPQLLEVAKPGDNVVGKLASGTPSPTPTLEPKLGKAEAPGAPPAKELGAASLPPPGSSAKIGENPPVSETQKIEAGRTAELAEKGKRTERKPEVNASVKPGQNGSPSTPQPADTVVPSTSVVPGGSPISTQDKGRVVKQKVSPPVGSPPGKPNEKVVPGTPSSNNKFKAPLLPETKVSQTTPNKPGGEVGTESPQTKMSKRETRAAQLGGTTVQNPATTPIKRPSAPNSAARMMMTEKEKMARQNGKSSRKQGASPATPSTSSTIPPDPNSQQNDRRKRQLRDVPPGGGPVTKK